MSEAAKKLLPDGHMRTIKAKERSGREFVVQEWPRVLEAMRQSIARIGPQEFAWDVGLPAATVSHMTNERNRSYLRAMHVLYALWRDPGRLELAKAFTEPAGLVVEKAPQVTVEESLLGLLAVIARNFPQLADRLMAEAHQEALAEASKRRGGG